MLNLQAKAIRIMSHHKQLEFGNEIENFFEIQKDLGIQKIKIKYIDKDYLYHLKADSLMFTRFDEAILKLSLDTEKRGVHLFKIKGKRNYKIGDGGNNRVFFLKNFPKLVHNRDWVWASVTEIDMKRAITKP